MATVVYRYGMRAPTGETLAILRTQLLGGYAYKRALVETANNFNVWKCAQARELGELGEASPEIEAKKLEIEQAREAQMAARVTARSKKTPVETKALKELQKQLKELRAALPKNPKLPSVIKQGEKVFHRVWLDRRKNRPVGLHDGTYNLIEAHVKQAIGKKLKGYFKFHKKKPIPARIYVDDVPDEGTIGHQIRYPGDKPKLDIFSANTQANAVIENGRMKLHLNVASKTYVDLDVNYHRPLPAEGRITHIDVGCRRIGTRMEWSVRFTVDIPQMREATGSGNVGVDIGWRRTSNGLKVAAFSDGTVVTLPAALMEALSKSESIQQMRDTRIVEIEDIVAPFRDRKFKWVNASQVLKFNKYWTRNRKDGDEQAFAAMQAWVYRDNHLHNYADGLAVRARRWRKDIYRTVAASMAKKFKYLAYENFDLAEKATDEEHTAQYARGVAAISELKKCLIHAMGKYNCVKVNPRNTTKECNACKSIEEVASSVTTHTCRNCGATYDRDINAAKNICERMSDEQIGRLARDKEMSIIAVGGMRRVARMKKEKNARARAARETLDNAAE